MQFLDFFNNAGNGLIDTVQIVLFRMLPRGAQIEKVRTEINRSLLKKYGQMTKLEIDKESTVININLDLKGENEDVKIKLSNYRVIQEEGKHPLIELGTIEVSRAWLDALLINLVKTGVIPRQIEVKNPLHQAVLKTIF